MAYALRFDFHPEPAVVAQMWKLLWVVVVLKLLLLLLFGQFGTLLSYFSLPDAQKVAGATLCGGLIIFGIRYFSSDEWSAPRSIVLSDFVFSFFAIACIRLSLRSLRERFQRAAITRAGAARRRVGIIGAGDVGAALVKDLLARPGLGMHAVAFADDNPQKWRTSIHGVSVLGTPEYLIAKAGLLEIEEVIIAMPRAPGKRVKEIVAQLNLRRLKFELVPSVEQLVNGHVRVSQLRAVEIEDLLRRPTVALESNRISQLIEGKIVMVTGGGGSIGSELCTQIQSYLPKQLLVIEQCEVQMFQIEQKLSSGVAGSFLPLVADVLDQQRMSMIFARYKPQIIFHAAAHKHVPMMENQPAEALRNNTIGTMQLADLAMKFGATHFVQISTDKAINPTNVMGATKRLAELYLQSLAAQPGQATRFIAVRFGNVLGSSGSVIPTFKRQIADGGPLTVTHPDVTRYFMTVHEAVGLVLQSGCQGTGGEIFVLDMGTPMKIADVARQLIQLSGLEPDLDIKIKYIGLRPGEKLYEEINHWTENMVATSHAKIMKFTAPSCTPCDFGSVLRKLSNDAYTMEPDVLKLELQKLVPEYSPYLPPR